MATLLTSEAITVELGANEPWPEHVEVFTPIRESQITLPEESHCRTVETFLTLCSLPYTCHEAANTEFMSPTNDVPMVKVGKFMVSEVDHIVGFINNKAAGGATSSRGAAQIIPDDVRDVDFQRQTEHGYFTGHLLSSRLTNEDRADMRAYMSLVESVIGTAELYVCWCDNDTYAQYTRPRYSSVFPFPLDTVMAYRKYLEVKRYLRAKDWLDKTSDEIGDEIHSALTALNERLGNGMYFFAAGPTELDALVYGHLSTIQDTPLPCDLLRNHLTEHRNLVEFVARFRRKHPATAATVTTGSFTSSAAGDSHA